MRSNGRIAWSLLIPVFSREHSQLGSIIPKLTFVITTMIHVAKLAEDDRQYLLQDISSTNVMHCSLSKAHGFFIDIFEMLFRRPELILDPITKLRDLQNYTWILYCYSRGIYFAPLSKLYLRLVEILLKEQWETVHELVLLTYCVTFVASLVNPAYRRRINDSK
jgi:hypothetical protein